MSWSPLLLHSSQFPTFSIQQPMWCLTVLSKTVLLNGSKSFYHTPQVKATINYPNGLQGPLWSGFPLLLWHYFSSLSLMWGHTDLRAILPTKQTLSHSNLCMCYFLYLEHGLLHTCITWFLTPFKSFPRSQTPPFKTATLPHIPLLS